MTLGHVALFALVAMVAGYVAGAAGSLMSRTDRLARLATSIGGISGSAAALVLALSVLVGGSACEITLPTVLEVAGGINLRIDALGAWFLLVVAAAALPASLYGFSYTANDEGRRSLRTSGVFFNVFVLGMACVPSAGNVLTFLIAWELMSLVSYFLVMTEAEHAETRLAGLWYIGMAEFGVLALLPMFLLLAPSSGQLTFADLRGGAALLTDGTRNVVFVLAVIGFGSKAGLVPLQVVLNDAGRIHRLKVVDPSFFNWPALSRALTDAIVPDFPLCNKSFNQSYSGHDL